MTAQQQPQNPANAPILQGAGIFGVEPEQPVEIDIKDLTDIASSKSQLYKALVMQGKYLNPFSPPFLNCIGQLFLPPKRSCSVNFLRGILQGEKSYFLNKDVPYVYIDQLEGLTIKNVLDKVYQIPDVKKYLPDHDEPEKFIPRDWLFAVVNKLDPTFFTRATAEVQGLRKKPEKESDKITTITVKPDLLKIIKDAKAQTQSKESRGNRQALTSLLTTKKKRKRREIEEPIKGLKTEITIKRARVF